MRRTALENLVLEHVHGLDEDVRDVLVREAEDPDSAFGAFCYYLDPDRETSQEEASATVTAVFASLSDRVADQIVRDEQGFPILAAITRDGDY